MSGLGMSQVYWAEYIEKLLEKYNLRECNSVITPIVPGGDKAFDASNDKIDVKLYQKIIGELLYLANRCQPDIAYYLTYHNIIKHLTLVISKAYIEIFAWN